MAKTHLRRPSSSTHTLCGYGASRVRLVAEDPSCALCLAKLYPRDPRRAEMRAVLDALGKAWARNSAMSLAEFVVGGGLLRSSTDAEFLAELQRWKR